MAALGRGKGGKVKYKMGLRCTKEWKYSENNGVCPKEASWQTLPLLPLAKLDATRKSKYIMIVIDVAHNKVGNHKSICI